MTSIAKIQRGLGILHGNDLENAGATWEDREVGEVVHDGQLIISRKPDDIPAFARTLIDQLAA